MPTGVCPGPRSVWCALMPARGRPWAHRTELGAGPCTQGGHPVGMLLFEARFVSRRDARPRAAVRDAPRPSVAHSFRLPPFPDPFPVFGFSSAPLFFSFGFALCCCVVSLCGCAGGLSCAGVCWCLLRHQNDIKITSKTHQTRSARDAVVRRTLDVILMYFDVLLMSEETPTGETTREYCVGRAWGSPLSRGVLVLC